MRTTKSITREDYDRAVATRDSYTVRDSKRDDAAAIVARDVAGSTCPRCEREFTDKNSAEFCHWITTRARVSSNGVWFGSVACRACNMKDEAARRILGLSPNEAFPYEYVRAYFHIPARFNNRADIIRMANEITCNIPKSTDSDIMSSALLDLERIGLI